MQHTAAASMLFILILNNDAFMKNPIGVKWKIPAYVFRYYDYSVAIRLTYLVPFAKSYLRLRNFTIVTN